jgi:hypothetical protein
MRWRKKEPETRDRFYYVARDAAGNELMYVWCWIENDVPQPVSLERWVVKPDGERLRLV